MWSANSYYYKVVREGNFALSLFHFANLYFTLRTEGEYRKKKFKENTGQADADLHPPVPCFACTRTSEDR